MSGVGGGGCRALGQPPLYSPHGWINQLHHYKWHNTGFFFTLKLAWKWSGKWDIKGNVGEEGAGGNNGRIYTKPALCGQRTSGRERERDINKALLCLFKAIQLLEQNNVSHNTLWSPQCAFGQLGRFYGVNTHGCVNACTFACVSSASSPNE